MTNQVYEIIHTSPVIKTLVDYLEDFDSPAFKYKDSIDKFLKVKNNEGITNRTSIEKMYKTIEEKKLIGASGTKLLLKVGTRLAIEKSEVNEVGLLTDGLQVANYDVNAFKARALAQLEQQENYAIVDTLKPIKGKLSRGITKESYPEVTVWIWCRSLANASNNYEGEIFNLTPFIEDLETNVTKNSGGNWQVKLPPLVCERTKQGTWSVKKASIQFFVNSRRGDVVQQSYIADDNLYQTNGSDDTLIRNTFLFHTMINTNDLVWIRFETLKLEVADRKGDSGDLYISKDKIVDRIYDMIGLVDNNQLSINPEGNDVSIDIAGRDLSKIFIEDGTHFFFLEMSQGMLGGPGSAQANGGLTKRLSVNNGLQALSLYFNTSIEKVFKFVINQLSNIKVVPDNLFLAYGNRRNTRFEEVDGDDKKYNELNNQANELKVEVIQSIAALRKNKNISFTSLVDEKKEVEAIYIELKRFLIDIRTQKVRLFSGNSTFGWDSFTYVNERGVDELIKSNTLPQYFAYELFNISETIDVYPDGQRIVQYIDQIIDIEQSKAPLQKGYKREVAPGIWQIINLVIDKAVLNRRIVDSSLSSANGSLVNFFRKVCQEPFVEYYADTYGDTYNLVVRRPPTDRQGIISMLQSQVETEELVSTEVDEESNVTRTTRDRVTPLIIDIEPEDVLNEQLGFDDTEAYSWYHLQPHAVFQGGNSAFSLAYLPAIFFQEYADIWGSKPLQIAHNYMPAIAKEADQKQLSIVEKQAVEDMRYLIESHAYLPFTRKGVIVTNGDRRYKAGNIIRYKATGEIFFIDGVKQKFKINDKSIERNSTLQVSRGMVEQLIYGVPLADVVTGEVVDYASYFNIIDTKPLFQYKTLTEYIKDKILVGKQTTLSEDTQRAVNALSSDISSDTILMKGNDGLHFLKTYTTDIKPRFIQLINAINKKGYYVIITSTLRTYEQQDALWRKKQQGLITMAVAKPGHSKHESGKAIDINIVNMKTGVQLTSKSSSTSWLSTGVPQIAKILGFRWGGDFSQYDPVHFDLLNAKDQPRPVITSLYEERTRAVTSTSIDTSKIFSNFKVNKRVFDFFLRQEQYDKRYVKSNNALIQRDDKGNIQKDLTEVVVKAKKKK